MNRIWGTVSGDPPLGIEMSDLRTNAPGIGSPQRSGAQGVGTQEAKGEFKGAEVHLIDHASLIANAAEELTFEFSEETEKDISDREVEIGRKSDSLDRFLKLTKIDKMMKALGDFRKKDLHRGLKALLKTRGNDPEAYRRQARQEFKDNSQQYVALTTLVEALKARGAPQAQVAAAEAAVAGLMQEHGKEIRSALNIGEAAQAASKADLGDLPELREAYRTNVHDYSSTAAVLDDLVKRFGEKNLDKSIQFMLRALASDLEAGGSSIDKTELGLVLADMNRLKTMTTVLGHCGHLMRNAKKFGAKTGFTDVSLLRSLVPLQDAPRVQKEQMSAIPDSAGLKELDGQIRFLTDLREVIRLIPLESYARPESRDKLLDAVNDALIEKAEKEEEEEDEE
jgi:type III secretion protein W